MIRRYIRTLDSDDDRDEDEIDAVALRLYLASDKQCQCYLFRNFKYRVARFNRLQMTSTAKLH